MSKEWELSNSEKSRLLFLYAALLRSPHKAKQLLKLAEKENGSVKYDDRLRDLKHCRDEDELLRLVLSRYNPYPKI